MKVPWGKLDFESDADFPVSHGFVQYNSFREVQIELYKILNN